MSMLGTKEVFTVGEIALLHGVSKKTVFTAIAKGELVAMRYNAKVLRILRPTLMDWYALCQRRAKERRVRKQPVSTKGMKGTKGTKGASSVKRI